jgi:hypothetical protein
MSHNPEATIVCPNCGYHAVYNYCAQCGQETHLHKETFIGLVVHFVAHYFHYDSKFWKTIKTLITKPGQLTIAYWNKQRARYIPPISLYIFISTIYFIVSIWAAPAAIRRAEEAMMRFDYGTLSPTKGAVNKEEVAGEMERMMPIVQKAMQQMPKVYFFLVPFLALLLKVFFLKRRNLFFVDHAVYSLHFHTLGFIIFLFQSLINSIVFSMLTGIICYPLFFIYSVLSMSKVYGITTGKATLYSALIGSIYMIIYGITSAMIVIYYLKGASELF